MSQEPVVMETTGYADRFEKAARAVVLLLGVTYLFFYLWIVWQRISYPFELEWMEGSSVCHVQRVLDGQPIYAKPSLEFVAAIYTPFYYYVSALAAYLIGNGFFALRLVSFLSSLGCLALIYLIVHRRTSSSYVSFLASCLFAATFRITGAWFDIARVDSFFLLLLLAGVYTFDSPRYFTRSILSPAILFLAFFTKQTALIAGMALALAALLSRTRSERILYGIIFGAFVVGSSLLMNRVTDGWYGYYIFDLAQQHVIDKKVVIFNFWVDDLLRKLPLAACFGLASFLFVSQKKCPHSNRKSDFLVLGSFLAISLVTRAHPGGYTNVLMPAYAAIILYSGIGFGLCLERLQGASSIKLILYFALSVQFVNVCYMPQKQVPSSKDRQKGEELLQQVSRFSGEVFWSAHPWYLEMIGKVPQAQEMAIGDILRTTGSEEIKHDLIEEISRAFSEARFDAIILDFEKIRMSNTAMDENYVLVDANWSGDSLESLTGWKRKPTFLYVRRSGK